jgi:hypothetical protein
MDALETMLVPFSTGEQLVEKDSTQIPGTDIRRAQPWKLAQDQRQFDHADVHAQASTAVNRDVTGSSNMTMSTKPGEALIPVESVKEQPALQEETHLLWHIIHPKIIHSPVP